MTPSSATFSVFFFLIFWYIRGTTIYIKNNGRSHEHLKERSFGNHGPNSILEVNGQPLKRTWTLLVETAREGQDSIQVDGRVQDDGWLVGDSIVVAPVSGRNFHSGPYKEQVGNVWKCIRYMEGRQDLKTLHV